jgi:hypothetical protein
MLNSDPVTIKRPARVPSTEYSVPFLQGMVNAMAMSYHKYGPVADAYPENVDAIKSGLLRLAKYIGTARLSDALAQIIEDRGELRGDGNTEWLIDAANFSMIEFMCPAHPKAHYKPTTEKQSPGRVWQPDEFDGSVEVSARANDGSAA